MCLLLYMLLRTLAAVSSDSSSRVSLELPCLSEPIIAAMMGPALLPKAANGKKQLQVRGIIQGLPYSTVVVKGIIPNHSTSRNC